jgi:hypothetical protein
MANHAADISSIQQLREALRVMSEAGVIFAEYNAKR